MSTMCAVKTVAVLPWIVVLAVNPSVYVDLITFCISEWLAAFSFVISFYFVVSFDEAVEGVLQSAVPTSMFVQNIMCTCNSLFPA